VMQVQPDEAISLEFGMKIPGSQVRVGSVKMDFAMQITSKLSPRRATNGFYTIA
jgi:glucose-6-phosphate 1-dehydrogenase